jgi:DNA-binding ferritin-like protein (Dps family)
MKKLNKKSSKMMIRSTFHHYRKFTNINKLESVDKLVMEYRSAILLCVNYLWDLKLEWGKKGKNKIWDRVHDLLECPSMISTKNIKYDGPLSARALKCVATQACGIIKAVTEKRQKDLNKKSWLISINKIPGKTLLNRINKGMIKPDCQSINCELNSICMDIKFELDKHFDGFVNFKSLWNRSSGYSHGFSVRIPIKNYRRSNKWKKIGALKTSVLLNESSVTLRWDVPRPIKKIKGEILAIDQGKTICLTASDGQKSIKDIHGHDLASIIDKMALKRPGSKAFLKACEHRKNYINWAIKKLDLTKVKEIKLEDIIHINYGRNVSRKMKRWVNTLIRDSVKKLCEETGVLFTLTPTEYNSQRCFICGWVQKANRKGKFFKCKHCGHEDDSDFNASQNIRIRDTLFVLPYGFRERRLNLRGFFWKPEGLFDASGQEFTVPVVSED